MFRARLALLYARYDDQTMSTVMYTSELRHPHPHLILQPCLIRSHRSLSKRGKISLSSQSTYIRLRIVEIKRNGLRSAHATAAVASPLTAGRSPAARVDSADSLPLASGRCPLTSDAIMNNGHHDCEPRLRRGLAHNLLEGNL